MTWLPSKHVDQRRQWPPLNDVGGCESVELAHRALSLLYAHGREEQDAYSDLESMHFETPTFCLFYWHDNGVVKVYEYSEPGRIKALALSFDLNRPGKWNTKTITAVLGQMRKLMVLDDLSAV